MCFNQVLNSVSQLWDLIKTWGFREDIKDIYDVNDVNDANDNDDNEEDNDEVEDNDNNKDDNNDKGVSALGLDRDLGFL